MYSQIYEKFKIPYVPRERNYPFEKVYRKDATYESLTKLWITNRPIRSKISDLVKKLPVENWGPMETQQRSLQSYVYALNKRWLPAAKEMYRIIQIEGGENIDSWIDIGHFLRKIESFEGVSLKILLNPEETITWYRLFGKELDFTNCLEDLSRTPLV